MLKPLSAVFEEVMWLGEVDGGPSGREQLFIQCRQAASYSVLDSNIYMVFGIYVSTFHKVCRVVPMVALAAMHINFSYMLMIGRKSRLR